jgi:oxygen-independent coproporphyrinogen-3 oxidase
VSSLFIGGGTPTALDAEELDLFLTTLRQGFRIDASIEQTIEGNPGTLTPQKLSVLKRQGINRISLGAQSFDPRLLKQMGRIHSVDDIREGVRLVREAGFTNLNLDLMFGLPEQTLSDWQRTLEETLRLRPEHLSVYGLMIEEDTPLALDSERLKHLPDEDLQAEMYDEVRKVLVNAGYRHYETSNFALPGYECQHNLGYWQGIEYFGLGPGAVSFIDNRRWKNIENLEQYDEELSLGKQPVDPEEDESITRRERMSERIILSLRLAEGLDLTKFEVEFGQKFMDIYSDVLERYFNQGILTLEEGHLKIKNDYWFVANSVLQEFA